MRFRTELLAAAKRLKTLETFVREHYGVTIFISSNVMTFRHLDIRRFDACIGASCKELREFKDRAKELVFLGHLYSGDRVRGIVERSLLFVGRDGVRSVSVSGDRMDYRFIADNLWELFGEESPLRESLYAPIVTMTDIEEARKDPARLRALVLSNENERVFISSDYERNYYIDLCTVDDMESIVANRPGTVFVGFFVSEDEITRDEEEWPLIMSETTSFVKLEDWKPIDLEDDEQ